MKNGVKMLDIANRIGVSVVTVSNALAGRDGVSEQMRKNICKIAEEMGYKPSNTKTERKKSEIKAVEEESKAIGQPSEEVQQALSEKIKQNGTEETVAKGLAKVAVLMMMDPACYGCKELEAALSTIVAVGPGPQEGAPVEAN